MSGASAGAGVIPKVKGGAKFDVSVLNSMYCVLISVCCRVL